MNISVSLCVCLCVYGLKAFTDPVSKGWMCFWWVSGTFTARPVDTCLVDSGEATTSFARLLRDLIVLSHCIEFVWSLLNLFFLAFKFAFAFMLCKEMLVGLWSV